MASDEKRMAGGRLALNVLIVFPNSRFYKSLQHVLHTDKQLATFNRPVFCALIMERTHEHNTMEPPHIYVERTLAIIKPDVLHKADEIEDIILRSGFAILQKRRVHLTPEQASDFYAEHYGKLFFPSLVAYMSSGPIIVLMIARDHAITYWRELIGPTNTIKARQTHPDCLRAIYGTDEQKNALHGSDSFMSSQREIRFFFPDCIVEPVALGQAAKDYLSKAVNPTLLRGLTDLAKKKPEDPVLWLADWLLENNPNKPKVRNPIVELA